MDTGFGAFQTPRITAPRSWRSWIRVLVVLTVIPPSTQSFLVRHYIFCILLESLALCDCTSVVNLRIVAQLCSYPRTFPWTSFFFSQIARRWKWTKCFSLLLLLICHRFLGAYVGSPSWSPRLCSKISKIWLPRSEVLKPAKSSNIHRLCFGRNIIYYSKITLF